MTPLPGYSYADYNAIVLKIHGIFMVFLVVWGIFFNLARKSSALF